MTTMEIKFFVPIVLALYLSFTIAAGECPGVRSLSPDAACREACGTELMYQLCTATLRAEFKDPRSASEVTAYALAAARRAFRSYGATGEAVLAALSNSSISGEDKYAYSTCYWLEGYYGATVAMGKVVRWLSEGCWFDGLHDEFMAALLDLERCRDLVMKLRPTPAVYPMIMDDRNRTFLAYILGKLLGIE
ncbi:hypothetical protein ACP70R_003502 [Stipagrostis hirtigluma subsp. patula]